MHTSFAEAVNNEFFSPFLTAYPIEIV